MACHQSLACITQHSFQSISFQVFCLTYDALPTCLLFSTLLAPSPTSFAPQPPLLAQSPIALMRICAGLAPLPQITGLRDMPESS